MINAMTEKSFSKNSRKRCSDIMSRNVKTADRKTTLQQIARLMLEGDMGALPIVENRKPVGIVTDRDIVVRAVAEGRDPSTSIGDVMTAEVFLAREDDFVFEVVRLMGEKQVRRIPVVNDAGELTGIIAIADIALEMEDEREIAETMEDISTGKAFWNKT